MPKKKAEYKRKYPVSTPEFHKARRQLVLWSALLLVWEFIGLDLEAMKSGGGTLGAFAQSIKNPHVVPWVLMILVLYFCYRFIIEWLQFDPKREIHQASKIDIIISLEIALIAIFLSLIKHLCDVQVALRKSIVGLILLTITFFIIGVFSRVIVTLIAAFPKAKTTIQNFIYICVLIIIALPLLYMIIWWSLNIHIIDPAARQPLAGIVLLIIFLIIPVVLYFLRKKI